MEEEKREGGNEGRKGRRGEEEGGEGIKKGA
jgi:hypothetical protein